METSPNYGLFNVYAWREVFVLLNVELRRLTNDTDDLSNEDWRLLSSLHELFGLDKCLPGMDSWDTMEILEEDGSGTLAESYEDYLESEIVAMSVYSE